MIPAAQSSQNRPARSTRLVAWKPWLVVLVLGLLLLGLFRWQPWQGNPLWGEGDSLSPDAVALLLLRATKVIELSEEQRYTAISDVWMQASLQPLPPEQQQGLRTHFLQAAYCSDRYLGEIQHIHRDKIKLEKVAATASQEARYLVKIPVDRALGASVEVLEYRPHEFDFQLVGYYWRASNPFFYRCVCQTRWTPRPPAKPLESPLAHDAP